MNILLTNEAGCFAPGITALAKALSKQHRVVIVAPLQPQFHCGHMFRYRDPLRIKQYNILRKIKVFSVNSSSCDCVTLALDKILHSKPDLIVTGIRPRHSRGEVIYSSGVVSAAIEGTIHGIPSIALSARVHDVTDERNFARVARSFVKSLPYIMKNMPPQTTLNINYPEHFSKKRIVCTHLTCNLPESEFVMEVNPFGNTYCWFKPHPAGYPLTVMEQKGDIYWLANDYITVTPLKLDLTCDEAIETVKKAGFSI